jgi:hypothetical protein
LISREAGLAFELLVKGFCILGLVAVAGSNLDTQDLNENYSQFPLVVILGLIENNYQ